MIVGVVDGLVLGSELGARDGALLDIIVGVVDGLVLGSRLGFSDGTLLGMGLTDETIMVDIADR